MREAGRIRIGQQVATQNGKKRPAKLDRFRLTSADRRPLDAAAAIYGGTVVPWPDAPVGEQFELVTETADLPIVMPPDGMAFSQWYEVWSRGGCQRRCDGVRDVIADRPCQCDPEDRECKPHTRLSVILADLPGIGLWRLDTQGYYAATELAGAVDLLQRAGAAGVLLPARLRLEQRQVVRGGKTVKFAVPAIEVDMTIGALRSGELPRFTPESVAELDAPAPAAIEAPKGNVTPVPAAETVVPSIAEQAAPRDIVPPKRATPMKATGLRPRPAGEVSDEPVEADMAAKITAACTDMQPVVDPAKVARAASGGRTEQVAELLQAEVPVAREALKRLREEAKAERDARVQAEVQVQAVEQEQPAELVEFPGANDPVGNLRGNQLHKLIGPMAAHSDLKNEEWIEQFTEGRTTHASELTKEEARAVEDLHREFRDQGDPGPQEPA